MLVPPRAYKEPKSISIAAIKGKREPVETRIYREFHRAIAERRLAPGTKLVEDTLAHVFKTSRARIRKVLLVLAQEKPLQ